MVAGGTSVFQDSLVGGGEPEKLEDGKVKTLVSGAEVVERGVSFGEGGDAGEMEDRVGGVADGNESTSDEGHGR